MITMKVSEAIEILNDCLEKYGDCRLMKMNLNNLYEVDDVIFIGGNRLLLKSDDIIDDISFEWYQKDEKVRNEKRKMDWLDDCEGIVD